MNSQSLSSIGLKLFCASLFLHRNYEPKNFSQSTHSLKRSRFVSGVISYDFELYAFLSAVASSNVEGPVFWNQSKFQMEDCLADGKVNEAHTQKKLAASAKEIANRVEWFFMQFKFWMSVLFWHWIRSFAHTPTNYELVVHNESILSADVCEFRNSANVSKSCQHFGPKIGSKNDQLCTLYDKNACSSFIRTQSPCITVRDHPLSFRICIEHRQLFIKHPLFFVLRKMEMNTFICCWCCERIEWAEPFALHFKVAKLELST